MRRDSLVTKKTPIARKKEKKRKKIEGEGVVEKVVVPRRMVGRPPQIARS